jgi:N4-gp56 family major capsid protein
MMAETRTPTALQVKQWSAKFFMEWVRENLFSRYMGTDEGAIIHIKEDLTTKSGNTLNFPLINKLDGDGVEGTETLDGAEEELPSDGDDVKVTYRRNAVKRTLEDEQSTVLDYLNAARRALKNWLMDVTKDMIITAMMAPSATKSYTAAQANKNANYTGAASEAEKDTWLAANDDRILFGAAKSNNSANDHSASLANVDSANDTLSTAIISLAKRMAKTTTPSITPYRTKEDEEWYVMFAGSLPFRDLKNDSAMQQANRDAWTRGKNNPIFRDGDLIWDGVVIREIPEIPVISGVGASSIDVGPNFLCGAGAIGMAIAKRSTPVMEKKDYGFRKGVGIMQSFGIKKLFFQDPDNPGSEVQHGMVTVYTAAVADT